jgi:Mce-associated membrane protein
MSETSRPRPRPRPRIEPDDATPAAPVGAVDVDLRKPVADPAPVAPAEPAAKAALAEPAEPAPTARPARAPSPDRPASWRWIVIAVGIVLVAGLVALNLWLSNVHSDRTSGQARIGDVETSRTQALASARTRVPAMLSYSYKNVTSFAKDAPANATGKFRQDYARLISTVIAPAAKQQHIITRATVKSAGVIDAHTDQVDVLVLLDQTTQSKSSATGRIDGSRIKVSMRKAGGTWLVEDLTPI